MKTITAEELRDIYVSITDWEEQNGKLPGRMFYAEYADRVNKFFTGEKK